jgi:hypothetical protein
MPDHALQARLRDAKTAARSLSWGSSGVATRELDAILSYRYRQDPALLAAWKSACRVERDAATEAKSPSAPAAAPVPAA